MKNVLIIALREAKRFKSRFRGGSRVLILTILAISLLISYFVAQSGLTLSKGVYTIGASPYGPTIDDSRFNVIIMDNMTGYGQLGDGSIDAYVDVNTVISRSDQRSKYAVGALKQYLEKSELSRITEEYDIDRAYPLRVETHYLNVSPAGAIPVGGSLSDLIGPTVEPVTSTPQPSQQASVNPTPTSIVAPAPTKTSDGTDAAVREQVDQAMNGTQPRFKAQFVSENETIIPSLMNPPMPLSQIILAFLYIVPIFFISVFFTSSFMDEKTNRRLNILMSAPVSALDIIAGKMLPYFSFALVVIVTVTLVLNGNLPLSLAIFIPVVLFIFAIYLMVALFYRTYKDQTFFSMAAITFITGYLVFPALFADVNSLSYISPLTLAVQMYRGESFSILEYVFSTLPMYFVFLIGMYVGVRIFNEEYLMGYGPLYRKSGDAIYLSINRRHVYMSVFLLSVFLIPIVFMVELIILALATNIQQMFVMIVVLLFFCAMVEEIAKSSGIVMLLENGDVSSYRKVLVLSFISALGFWLGEKALLALSLSIMPGSALLNAMSGTADTTASPIILLVLLLLPLAAHFVFTSTVCVSTKKLGARWYFAAVMAGTLIHTLYNVYSMHSMGAF
ncbi:MAG TPA: ABC transporter permease [Methanocella sp.]|nr:ABC transporter permease [Methanocella sp.]